MMFGTREVFTYSECGGCGCLWLLNVPSDLSKHYGAGYYSLEDESRLTSFVRRNGPAYWINHIIREKQRPSLPEWWPEKPVRRGARVLDVGSGFGGLLFHLKALGFKNLTGIDPFIKQDTANRDGPTILRRSLEEMDGEFDVLMLNHSFEHMPRPREVMRHLKRLLAPRGSVVIRTPVSSSFAWKKYGADWVQLDPPRHLFVPSVASLKAFAATAALTVESILFDSTAFQFWASEQYRQGIALHDPRSYLQSPRGSVFSRDQIKEFTQLARELNNRAEGDQASFTLRAS
jgi:SAM-dependent methyltransferase